VTTPLRTFLAVCILSGLVYPAKACLWDRDTLAAEARGLPGVVEIITGRFERNPALYYEKRLQRVLKELETDPFNFSLLDDAAVACDRLGRQDEALRLMERKRLALEAAPPDDEATSEGRYRYLANTGTFYAHRWFANGASQNNRDDLELARSFVCAAIQQNPGAHFGREIYQLKFIEAFLDPPPPDEVSWPFVPGALIEDQTAQSAKEAIRGYTGLIALGNAWESPAVFLSLAQALGQKRDPSVAHLAYLRAEEIARAQGGRSPEGARQPPFPPGGLAIDGIEKEDYAHLETEFLRLRKEADAWHRARTSFMIERLQKGLHPDIDGGFWFGYFQPRAPALSSKVPVHFKTQKELQYQVVAGAIAAAIFVVALFVLQEVFRRRRPRT